MIWMDRTFEPQPRHYLVEQVVIDGVTYDLYVNPVFGQPWKYIAFASHPAQLEGTLDVKKFLDYLVDRGHVPSDHYLPSLELGNEVKEGTGQVWFRRYRVHVE